MFLLYGCAIAQPVPAFTNNGSAQLENGDFSIAEVNGDGIGWEFVPGPGFPGSFNAVAFQTIPPQGSASVLGSGFLHLDESTIRNAFDGPGAGVTMPDLDTLVSNSVTGGVGASFASGSFFYQDFQSNAFGDTISFTYGFQREGPNRDAAYAVLYNVTDDVIMMSSLNNNNNVFEMSNTGNQTPSLNVSPWIISAADGGKNFRIGFIIVNGDDNQNASSIGITAVQQAALPSGVPEINADAGVLPLAAIGLLLVVVGDGRRRKALQPL
jgi:hypothetical protein